MSGRTKEGCRAASAELLETIGKNVRAHRVAQGLSQEDLAFEAGMHRTFLSMIERGKRNVSIGAIEGISDALGVPLHQLLFDIES